MIKPLFASWLLAVTVGCASLFVFGQTPAADSLDADIANLKAPEVGTRVRAAETVGMHGPAGKPAVPALIQMLNSNEKIEKLAAIIALARIGSASEPALPALKTAETSSDKDISSAARAAHLTIAPPMTDVAMSYLSNPYVFVPLAAVGLCVAAIAALGLRRGGSKLPDAKWREEQSKVAAARAKASAQPAPAPAPAPAPTPAHATAPPRQHATDRLGGKPRARMSKPLNTFDNYVNASAESPESIKRDFMRAQDDLQRIIVAQEEIWEHLESEDLRRDPERARLLRKHQDEYSIEHYRADVRLKALEIKVMESLLGDGSSADPDLLERTEARLKEKWDGLRTQLESPTKISYRNGQWISSPNGQPTPIEDLRAKLREFDVAIPERIPVMMRQAPEAAHESEPAPQDTPTTGELISALDPNVRADELRSPEEHEPKPMPQSTEGAIVEEPAAKHLDDGPEESAPV